MPRKHPEQQSKQEETGKSAEKVQYHYSRNQLLMFKHLKVYRHLPEDVVLPADIIKTFSVPANPEKEECIEHEATQSRYS